MNFENSMRIDLRISGQDYEKLKKLLFPGDNNESVAIALCGLSTIEDSTKVLVHRVVPIPNEDCLLRTPTTVHWRTTRLLEALETASKKKLAILKIHSHPTGYSQFSEIDDNSDNEMFNSAFSWIENIDFHVSAVMLPNGEIFGRAFKSDLTSQPLDKVMVVGDDIRFLSLNNDGSIQDFNVRTAQAFGNATTSLLKKLSVAVIGCSGTGSPTIEQLVRLGFGKILLVDPDIVEKRNLNRILNSRMSDVDLKKYKVDVLRDHINSIGLGITVETYPINLYDDVSVIKRISHCDLMFGCVDSVDGRQLLNNISTFYVMPYFDLGVKLIADGIGGIEQIWGTVHYLQPGKSSLLTRGVFTIEDITAASIYRSDPIRYKNLRSEGYIRNVNVESPAVISVNMQVSSLALIELLARLHRFRYDDNAESAITRISLTDSYIQKQREDDLTDAYLEKFVGRGDIHPFLNMPELN